MRLWLMMWSQYMKRIDRKSTRLNSSHVANSYAVFRLKKKRAASDVHARAAEAGPLNNQHHSAVPPGRNRSRHARATGTQHSQTAVETKSNPLLSLLRV